MKRAQSGPGALRRSDLYFEQLLTNLPAAAYTCDAEGLITYFNRRAAQVWGREPELNDPADRFCGSYRLYGIDGSPLDRSDSWMALALRNEKRYEGKELVLERPDGSRVTILASASPIHDEAGQLLGAISTLVDISERKLAEQAPARLAAIVESSDDAIVSKDLNGVIRSWNRGAQALFGYDPEEAIGQSITLIIPDERLDEEADILARIRRGERVDHFETVRRRKDGRLVDISLTVSPVKDPGGTVVGASKIARDITERRLAQQALREQALTLATINRVADTLAGELDLRKLVKAVTDAGRDLSGSEFGAFFYNQANDGGPSYSLFGSSGTLPEGFGEEFVRRKVPHVFAGGSVVSGPDPAEERERPDDSTELRLGSYFAVPVVSRSGKVLGALFFGDRRSGVFRKPAQQVITAIASHAATALDNALLYEEARSLNETLEEKVEQRTADLNALNQELETFNYSVAHDLRGSLRGIDGFSNLILEESGDDLSESVRKYLARIRSGAQRMGQLLDNLLELSRLIRVDVRQEKVDLGRLAQEILDEFREWEPEREVEVVIAACTAVKGDRGLMRIAMENLLSNAWKFSNGASPARIEVGCQVENGERVYFVRDNGVGFDARYEDKLFEPFQRLHAPDSFDGTGIGLANVKRIIEKHGGRIWATSEVGRGATFYFTLSAR